MQKGCIRIVLYKKTEIVKHSTLLFNVLGGKQKDQSKTVVRKQKYETNGAVP